MSSEIPPRQQTMLPADGSSELGKALKGPRGRGALPQHQQQQQQQQQGPQQGRRCARCNAAFGRFYNTGAPCPRCRHRVCRQCRELRNPQGTDWLCSLCNKIQDLRAVSVEWRHTTGRDNYLSALDILKHSIRRAWTINGPPARWSAARKSAEFRLYRSLPNRRREFLVDEENTKNAKKPTESFIKPPRIINKTPKQNESKKSSIPVFRNRSSKEFEDIRGPHESPKRSLIPQRYRGSTDDLRRSREDINIPSFIPKLLSPRNKEDKLKRQDSKDDVRPSPGAASKFQPQSLQPQQNPQEANPTAALRIFRRDSRKETCHEDNASLAAPVIYGGEASRQECSSAISGKTGLVEEETSKMVEESNLRVIGETCQRQEEENRDDKKEKEPRDETDEAPQISSVDSSCISKESKICDKSEDCAQVSDDGNAASLKEPDKQRLSESALGKKIDEPVVVKRKFSKEELSNDDTDDAPNRRCSSHLSPEASPLSTRSSRYSPRESESEPTPALPRKTAGERGESSSASQRIRDAITRTRRESNSSAKYESSGSEGVRLSESGLSSYVDIARRVKLFGSGSIGPSTGSCDEVLQRDSATSAGEDDHDDHSRDPTRMGPTSQNRVMLRRRRQFDAQGPRRRGRSHARSCCGAEDLQALQVVGCPEEEPAALLDYRRLVFISSDSSSGREEDDADSSCSGSSYLNGQPAGAGQQGPGAGAGLEDCDWDYFESNSLKLPQLQSVQQAQVTQAQNAARDWSCCPAKPSASATGCCQACGGSRNAKVLPVPVPIPVPVPYPVPVPASLWTGEFAGLERARAAAASSMISRDAARLEQSLPLSLRGCDPSAAAWFSWNPRFDSSSLLFSQEHIFPREISSAADVLLQPEKQEEKAEPEKSKLENTVCETESKEPAEIAKVTEEKEEQPEQQQQRMFRHSQEQDSRSSSGRSSADSSDLEDSASHRFSRVLIVNDDSLTSDNDIEDNEDSDSAREGQPITLRRVSTLPDSDQPLDNEAEQEPVVLRRIRLLDEDGNLNEDKSDQSSQPDDDDSDQQSKKSKNRYCVSSADNRREIASYDEIYLASTQDNSENLVLLKSVRSIDPENIGQSTYRSDSNFAPGFKAFPKQQTEKKAEEPEEEETGLDISCESERDDSSNDSAVMPDSLEVSMQDLEDSIEIAGTTANRVTGRALLAASSPVEGKSLREALQEREQEEEKCSPPSPSSSESSGSSGTSAGGGALSSGDELCEYALTSRGEPEQQQQQQELDIQDSAALMAKSRKKWQIPASFDIKGLPSTHFMPPERNKNSSHSSLNPLLIAAVDTEELQPEDEDNANGFCPAQDDTFQDDEEEEEEDMSLAGSTTSTGVGAHDESSGGGGGGGASGGSVRGEREPFEQVGGSAEDSRYRAVERRTPTRKEEGLEEDELYTPSPQARRRDWIAPKASLSLNHLNNNVNGNGVNNQVNNKYRSLVMITQGAYQPVNVITSDTTTLLQPQLEQSGYFQLAHDANPEATRRNIGPVLAKKPLPCKRLLTNSEPEVDSGLSVGSASESDDVQSVKNAPKQASRSPILLSSHEEEFSPPPAQECTSYGTNKRGPLILEEGLADDDSWVEEISHDEDEQSATTATEESSEDEAANNLGDREEELRGYHRQAIDFTLHTIVEESCEESESEHASASWRRRVTSASAPDLDKYYFFGLGADGAANSSRELDSLSETSSIFSEGLDSLAREENAQKASQEKNSGEYTSGSSRLEKYCLNEFLGLEQDRRDSDGSVGSDSEGHPSPEAQRRKRLVRARGTGRSHSSSLDNLLALAHSGQNSGSHQNSLQDVTGTDGQETLSEGSSTETDGADENPAPAFGADGQFDTVKRKKKKPRNPGAQSPRVSEDRNKTPEPRDSELLAEEDLDAAGNSEEDGAKTPQPENILASSQAENLQSAQDDSMACRSKQQSRDSGFVGSCDDLLLTPQRNTSEGQTSVDGGLASGDAAQTKDYHQHREKERNERLLGEDRHIHERILETHRLRERLTKIDVHIEQTTTGSLSRKDSFNNWSSDEETNLMMSKMRQFFKTMVANSNNQNQAGSTASSAASPAPSPSPRLSGYSSKTSYHGQTQNRTKPPQLVYFENELTRLMKTVPGIRDEQVREIVEYLSSEDTWSDSYDSSDYTSSDLEGATAGGRRSALQEQISQSCQQIISKFDTNANTTVSEERGNANERRDAPIKQNAQQGCLGRDTAFVYQKLVQSFTKMAGDNVTSDASSTPHSSPPLIAKVMHHIGSRLVALMHEVSESNSTVGHSHSSAGWRRYPHHRTPSSASTTEDDDSTSDSASAPTQLPRSKSHDPLLLINGHTSATSMPPEAEEREASDYERFSWRGSFESALMAADSRTKLSLLACSGDVSATAMAAKRRSAGDLLFNPKSFSREQLDRVRSCGSIGGTIGAGTTTVCGGSIEEKIWSNRRRSSVPDANTRGESGASAGDEDTEDDEHEDLDYGNQGDPRATTLPRGMQMAGNAATSATNSLPRQASSSASMHKAHSVYHFLPQHSAVKSARYRPPGFTRNSPSSLGCLSQSGPKRAFSAPGLQLQSRPRRQQPIAHSQANANTSSSAGNVSASASVSTDEASSLSEACSTPIIGTSSRTASSHASMDLDDIDRSFQSTHLATRASLSSLGARSDSMASVYSGAGEGRWCGSVAVRGEVEFSLQYDYKQLTFEVHVTQCRDLAPVDVKRNRSDPYVKVYLLPDKSKSGKRKTKVKKHTLNPVFDETLKFHTSLNSLESRTLWLTVWHSDMFGRNDFLGEVRMPLENKIFDDPRPQWYPLQERTEPFDDPVACKGEVIVGLKFVPPDPARQDRERDSKEAHLNKMKKNWSKGALHVLVKEARNLQTRAKNSGTCDPFCKSYLLPDKGRSGKQKTGVVRRSSGSPVWNHTFVYKDVSLQELAERGLELTVWDHDRIASNEFLGGVRFNLGTGKNYGKAVDWMDATGREMSLWQSMLERPNFWVEGVVTLRPNLHNHGKTGTS